MKKLVYILIGIVLVSCNGKKEADETVEPSESVEAKINPRLVIVPGKSIGNIALEMNADRLEQILGKPDLSDAAMGKAWLTWFSKVSDTVTGNELNVYTEYKDNEMKEKVVRQIRITSKEFETANGIRTGMTLDEISGLTGTLTLIGKYDTSTDYPIGVYDNIEKGIAFEIERDNTCSGIIVHKKGERVSEEYITFHPDMMPM